MMMIMLVACYLLLLLFVILFIFPPFSIFLIMAQNAPWGIIMIGSGDSFPFTEKKGKKISFY